MGLIDDMKAAARVEMSARRELEDDEANFTQWADFPPPLSGKQKRLLDYLEAHPGVGSKELREAVDTTPAGLFNMMAKVRSKGAEITATKGSKAQYWLVRR